MTATPAAQIIAGRYEVRKSLGMGNFGEVYEVFDHYLQQTCALKLLKTTPFGAWAEAQILRRLHGEYILPILNADLAQGRGYVVTELATHGTVADQITQDVGVPVVTAVRWARQACAGVARIHDHNLLHCDIKPENLFLDERGDVLVGDLGLAQLMDQNGMVHAAGSIPTMAPEVAQVNAPGQAPPSPYTYSVRSDGYSLGATLFWMLAGNQPVPGVKSHGDVWAAPQPDLWKVAPHVPQGLRNIVNIAINRDPSGRYATPSALDAALGGRTLPARQWTRVAAHPGHVQCFEGVKGGSRLGVCAIPTGNRTQIDIRVHHVGTHRAVRNVGRTVPSAGLAAALRGTFRLCG